MAAPFASVTERAASEQAAASRYDRRPSEARDLLALVMADLSS